MKVGRRLAWNTAWLLSPPPDGVIIHYRSLFPAVEVSCASNKQQEKATCPCICMYLTCTWKLPQAALRAAFRAATEGRFWPCSFPRAWACWAAAVAGLEMLPRRTLLGWSFGPEFPSRRAALSWSAARMVVLLEHRDVACSDLRNDANVVGAPIIHEYL